jgi:hypothetical protein
MTALNLALARERGHDVPPPPTTAKGGAKTYREKFLDRYELPDRSYSLEEVSKITSVPMDILQEVYNRGIGAYKTNPQSVRLKGSFVKNVAAPMSKKLSKEQWAMARVMMDKVAKVKKEVLELEEVLEFESEEKEVEMKEEKEQGVQC